MNSQKTSSGKGSALFPTEESQSHSIFSYSNDSISHMGSEEGSSSRRTMKRDSRKLDPAAGPTSKPDEQKLDTGRSDSQMIFSPQSRSANPYARANDEKSQLEQSSESVRGDLSYLSKLQGSLFVDPLMMSGIDPEDGQLSDQTPYAVEERLREEMRREEASQKD